MSLKKANSKRNMSSSISNLDATASYQVKFLA